MSDVLPTSVLVIYGIFSVFAAFQKFCIRDFQGQNIVYKNILSLFSLLTSLFGVSFLIFYGFEKVWWAPFILFGVGLLAFIPLGLIERLIPMWILGMASFIVIPVCGLLLFMLTL